MPPSPTARRPQLEVHELYQLKWLLGGALALISAWTVLYMEVAAWSWLLLITLAVPLVTLRPTLTRRLPSWLNYLAFPLLLGTFALDLVMNMKEPLPSVIRLSLMLVLFRAITPRKRRDDLQLIVLGLFLVVVAGVISVSPLFAVHIVVFTGLSLLFLLIITLLQTGEQGAPAGQNDRLSGATATDPDPAWMQVDWRALRQRVRACSDGRVVLAFGGLFLGVVALSGGLFMALPRFEIGNSLFLENLLDRQSKAGFSEDITFGQVTDIQQDTSLAFNVDVSDRSQFPGNPYWRMLVLDEYTGAGFRVSKQLRERVRAPAGYSMVQALQGVARYRPDAAVWTIYLQPGISSYLPLLGSFYELRFDGGGQQVKVGDEERLVTMVKMPSKMLAYKVDGMRFTPALGVMERVPSHVATEKKGAPRPDYLSLGALAVTEGPEAAERAADRRRLQAWVEELGGKGADAQAFARQAGAWLGQKHSYSMQSKVPPGRGDLLVRWLGSTEPGHCELFAGAFALLARTAGYPARVVTGFRGGTWNDQVGSLAVRNSNAHAWCELWDAQLAAWLRVDPTPGGSIVPDPAQQLTGEEVLASMRDSSWNQAWESLQMYWYRQIVNFDQTEQLRMLDDSRKALEERMRTFKAWMEEQGKQWTAWARQPWDWRRLAVGAAMVLAVVSVALLWRWVLRPWWWQWRSRRARAGADPVRREAGRWLRRLAGVNAARATAASADGVPVAAVAPLANVATGAAETKVAAVASRAAGQAPLPAPIDVPASARSQLELEKVRSALERLRYGPRESWPEPLGVFRAARRALRT